MNKPIKEKRVVGHCADCGAPIFATWFPPCEDATPGPFLSQGFIQAPGDVTPSCACLVLRYLEVQDRLENRNEEEPTEAPAVEQGDEPEETEAIE